MYLFPVYIELKLTNSLLTKPEKWAPGLQIKVYTL